MSFNQDIQQSTVQGLITLYELDARTLGGDIYRFHGHNDGVITWQGKDFHPIAISAEGLEARGDGREGFCTDFDPCQSIKRRAGGDFGFVPTL